MIRLFGIILVIVIAVILLAYLTPDPELSQPKEDIVPQGRVMSPTGVLSDGYVKGRACTDVACGDTVVHVATGVVIAFQNEWATGYAATGNGQEVIDLNHQSPGRRM